MGTLLRNLWETIHRSLMALFHTVLPLWNSPLNLLGGSCSTYCLRDNALQGGCDVGPLPFSLCTFFFRLTKPRGHSQCVTAVNKVTSPSVGSDFTPGLHIELLT